jgi:hypothetical protein
MHRVAIGAGLILASGIAAAVSPKFPTLGSIMR